MSAAVASDAQAWREPRGGGRWTASLGLALLLEAALLGVMAWLLSRPAPPPPPVPIEITLTQPRPLPKPVLAKPTPPKPPPPKPLPKPLPKPKPVVHPQPRPHPLPRPKPIAPPVQPRLQPPPPAPRAALKPAMPVVPPAPAPKPKPLPVHAPDLATVRLNFEGALREAVQAAVRYPEAARLMHVGGRVLVSFRMLDGKVSDIAVVQSSGIGALDRAARAAVADAPYPPTPTPLAGQAMHFRIWVRFHLDDNS